MDYTEFIDSVVMMNKGREEDINNEKILTSFGSWQINETIKAIMYGNDYKSTDFLAYARSLHLLQAEQPVTLDKDLLEKEREEALKIAEEILQLDRGQKA